MAKPSKPLPEAAVANSVQRSGWTVESPLEDGPSVSERRANESGQSTVWRAMHPEKSAGVLKVARGRAQPERIRREIEILRRIPHPAIAPILDADIECDPPWMITAQGFPLVEVWDPTTMTDEERFTRAQNMILQIAAGLDLAHRNGVVHRDIKPENVILMRTDDPSSAALIDFGIAHDAQGKRLTEIGGRPVANQFAAPPEAYYGPLTDPPPWWDCLGLAWLWGWLISDNGREPKASRYHWKYQPLMSHPRAESVRALIAACTNESTAPRDIGEFLELATRLGVGRASAGARRTHTAFTDAANQFAAAAAAKHLKEQQRLEEIEGCAYALATIYKHVTDDLNQIVEEVRVLGLSARANTNDIIEGLNGLSVGNNATLWACSTGDGRLDIRLIAHYDPAHESVWPVEFRIWRPERETPHSSIYHRRDGTPVDPMGLAPTNEDTLQCALESILNTFMTTG